VLDPSSRIPSNGIPESLQSKNARAAIANWANANLALATKLFGQHNAKLSRPPRDFRFGDDGSISLNAITGHWTYQKYGGDLEEIDEIHNEIAEKGNGVGWPAIYAELRRRYTLSAGLEHLPFEVLGEGITLDDLYPPEECAALRAHGLTDDEILDLSPEQMHEILIAGAGYTKEGQDNDAVLAHAVKKIADKVSQALGCFVFIIDHFGKDVSTGTRGSSVKEVDADVIVACLGKRSEAGEITSSSLAIRKRRAGPTGEEFPFKGRIVDMGLNPHTGRMETTLVIDWDHRHTAHPTKPKNEWGRSKGVKLLRRIIMNLMADCGEQIKPFANGPLVRALKVSLVEAEFLKSYVTVGETEKAKKDAKRKAFQRAVDTAGDNLTTREIGSIDYIWLVNPSPAENVSAQPKPRKPPKSDDLPYTGPVVEIPDLGPDSLDEHGIPQE